MKIGIAISTHNRREIADECISKWREFLPVGAKFVIVDDASDIPYPGSDYRFEKQAGISVVKNKCLELLQDCDQLFICDDDIYPRATGWAIPYVFSNLQHACYIFERKKLWSEPDYIAYELPRGCFLYFTKRCIDISGGFDTNFKVYGYEHAELSRRIFNMKLTPAAYVDIRNSEGLFFSYDEQKITPSSLNSFDKTVGIRKNKPYFESTKLSNQFIPYK